MDLALISDATGVTDAGELAQIAKILDETVFFSKTIGSYTVLQRGDTARLGAQRANQIRLGQLARHGAQIRSAGVEVHEALLQFNATRARLDVILAPALSKLALDRFPIDSVQPLSGIRFGGASNGATTAVVRRHHQPAIDYARPELSEVVIDASPIRKDGLPAATLVQIYFEPAFTPGPALSLMGNPADLMAVRREHLHMRIDALDSGNSDVSAVPATTERR